LVDLEAIASLSSFACLGVVKSDQGLASAGPSAQRCPLASTGGDVWDVE
jgi:hypothetical protein